MDEGFWHRRWRKNEISFHKDQPNALMVEHFKGAFATEGGRVLVPLCGKTRDIGWLLAQGCRVAGAELSRLAVDQLFAELGLTPEAADLGPITRCSAAGIDIFVGNILDLSAAMLGPVDVTYDRAALVALPEAMREGYAAHLVRLTEAAPQFLITFEYDQTRMPGPPFSVTGDDLRRLYGARYGLTLLASTEVVGGLKGQCPATEQAWLLRPA